ncbi:hypothetical protein [Pseudarthrobacter sp. NPDC058119]|uniref:hypothetical protein n=1 Tax=Pseudarthrobacter sp. NPDC058119 TaxID=3346348 RepID=UPI0036D7D8F6
MRKMTKKNKIAAVALSATLLAAGGGAAYAYWSTTGSGSGTAAAAKGTTPVTINLTVDPNIAPGSPKTITYTADNSKNTSSTPVTLSGAHVSGTSNAGCSPDWFTATVPTDSTGKATTTTVVGGDAAAALGTGTLTLNDDPAVNQDACKGATITVSVDSQ